MGLFSSLAVFGAVAALVGSFLAGYAIGRNYAFHKWGLPYERLLAAIERAGLRLHELENTRPPAVEEAGSWTGEPIHEEFRRPPGTVTRWDDVRQEP